MDGDLAAAFGAVIRARRKASSMTQEALADATGISSVHLSRLERGTSDSTLGTLFRLSRSLDSSPVEIIKEVEDRLSP